MDDKARLGRRLLTVIIVVAALGELALACLSLHTGRFRGAQIGRVLLTGWLLWRIWDGAGWARWLTAGLFFAGAALAVALAFDYPVTQSRPEVAALLVGAVFGAFGFGLASPWVGAYQAFRRGGQGAAPQENPVGATNEQTALGEHPLSK